LATYAIGKIAHRPEAVHVGGDLIRAQVLTGVLTQSLKYGVDRTRPNGGRRSFPSGHSSASFASAAVVGGHFGWKGAVPAYAVASFIGWTRVRDHVHYPSDVIFGAAMGILVGHTVTAGHRTRTWTVMPAKTPGGMAIYVVKTGDGILTRSRGGRGEF
jgi:membrane-associated phospholipid phosphatase